MAEIAFGYWPDQKGRCTACHTDIASCGREWDCFFVPDIPTHEFAKFKGQVMSEEKRAFDKPEPVVRSTALEPVSDKERTHADDGSTTIIEYVTHWGFNNIDLARQEARALLGDRVRIIALVAQTERGKLDGKVVGYFCVPEGQRCPCCTQDPMKFDR